MKKTNIILIICFILIVIKAEGQNNLTYYKFSLSSTEDSLKTEKLKLVDSIYLSKNHFRKRINFVKTRKILDDHKLKTRTKEKFNFQEEHLTENNGWINEYYVGSFYSGFYDSLIIKYDYMKLYSKNQKWNINSADTNKLSIDSMQYSFITNKVCKRYWEEIKDSSLCENYSYGYYKFQEFTLGNYEYVTGNYRITCVRDYSYDKGIREILFFPNGVFYIFEFHGCFEIDEKGNKISFTPKYPIDIVTELPLFYVYNSNIVRAY